MTEAELTASQIDDLRLASAQMSSATRRRFQAEITLKYCGGSARNGESVFGWKRSSIATGLGEKRSGLECVGAQGRFSGIQCWETTEVEAALVLRQFAEAHSQQDPTFSSTIAYTRLTAAAAIAHLKSQGFDPAQLPSPSTMSLVLSRMGYRLRKVLKAKPKKKCLRRTRYLPTSKATVSIQPKPR
jgi:Rhodopirellula transposase DDE domain